MVGLVFKFRGRPVEPYTPTVAEVAGEIRARTKTSDLEGGVEAGTFNDDTRPTFDEAVPLIDLAVSEIKSRAGQTVPKELWSNARYVAILHAATAIERSYVPEQADDRNSAYSLLKTDLDEAFTRLVKDAQMIALP